MMRRWLAVNDKAEREGNWRCLADYFSEDCVYGWDTPNGKYEFTGRETIRETCVGAAMDPYQGWTYPYDKIVIDETRGEAFVTPDLIQELAVPVIAHRLVLGSESQYSGGDAEAIVSAILQSTSVPA